MDTQKNQDALCGPTNSLESLPIPEAVMKAFRNYCASEQMFEQLTNSTLERMKNVAKMDTSGMNFSKKCKLIHDVQNCLYDLQLIEFAKREPIVELAKNIFYLNKNRCMKRKNLDQKTRQLISQRSATALDEFAQRSLNDKIEDSNRDSNSDKNQCELNSEVTTSKNEPTENANKAILEESTTNHGFKTKTKHEKKRMIRDKSLSFKEFSPATPEQQNEVAEKVDKEIAREAVSQNEDNQQDDSSDKDLSDEIDAQPIRPSSSRKRTAVVPAAFVITHESRSISPRKKNNSTSVVVEETSGQDEPTYCICEQISYGDMICCDNIGCSIEWFHFQCVNIKTKPKGKWYCPSCIANRKGNKK